MDHLHVLKMREHVSSRRWVESKQLPWAMQQPVKDGGAARKEKIPESPERPPQYWTMFLFLLEQERTQTFTSFKPQLFRAFPVFCGRNEPVLTQTLGRNKQQVSDAPAWVEGDGKGEDGFLFQDRNVWIFTQI